MNVNKDYLGNYERTISFYNTKATSYFNGDICFKSKNANFRFKKIVITALNFIERTFIGTFNKDLGGIINDSNLFQKMYPYACSKTILNLDSIRKISKLSQKFEHFRNIIAHAKITEGDLEWLKCNYNVNNIIKLDDNIKYQRQGVLTFAGILMLLILFLRQEQINSLISIDRSILVLVGKFNQPESASKFCELYTQVTLTNPIRKIEGDNLLTSIFGEYEDFVEFDNNKFSLIFGATNHPTYIAKGEINDNKVTLFRKSLTKSYYVEDYELEIINQDDFIYYSNQLPVLGLIDYLHEKGFNKFDDACVNHISNNRNLISKINHSKFYGDKNLHILCLPNTVSDLRLISSAVSKTLFLCFLNLEKVLYNELNTTEYSGYSRLQPLLKKINLSEDLIKQIVCLRNFAIHGYILDEYLIINDEPYQFSIKNMVSSLSRLFDELKIYDETIYEKIYRFTSYKLINDFIRIKYNKTVQNSENFLKSNSNTIDSNLNKCLDFIKNSGIDDELFGEILKEKNEIGIIDLYIPCLEKPLYLYRNEESMILIKAYCENNNMHIADTKCYSIHKKITLKML